LLITFAITDPPRFIYSLTADDFDQVLQAACQEGVRRLARTLTAESVSDLVQRDADDLRAALSAEIESYGATINRVHIPAARPPEEFVRLEEARRFAVAQRAEQAERQASAEQHQRAEEALARLRVTARVERERAELESRIQQAEAQRRVAEL